MPSTCYTAEELSIPKLRNALKPYLSNRFFQRSPYRILYLLGAYASLVLHLWVTVQAVSGSLHWAFSVITLLVTINTSSFFFFFFHELLHGAVIKRGKAMRALGFLSGIPTLCAPTIWIRWHNTHHAHTAGLKDPDRARSNQYDDFSSVRTKIEATLKKFHISDGISYLVPFGVIIGHHFLMYVDMILDRKVSALVRIKLSIEYLFVLSIFFSPLLILQLEIAFIGIYLPALLGQMICNLYILSNHNSRLLTRKNLPLLNSLSVFLHRKLPISHMGFGRHVEHHIFPEVGHNRLKEITPILRKEFPESFTEVPLAEALIAIYTRTQKEQQVI